MAEVRRITAAEARKNLLSGSSLLVCAYDDPSKFDRFHLDGAISLAEFKSRLSYLNKDQEVIFYCA